MKYIIPILFVLFFTTNAQANIKAQELVDAAKAPRTSQDWGVALGYFRGVLMTHEMYQIVGERNKKFIGSDGKPKTWGRSCRPGNEKVGNLMSHWVYWAESSPSFEPKAAAYTQIIKWFFRAYPCGEAY